MFLKINGIKFLAILTFLSFIPSITQAKIYIKVDQFSEEKFPIALTLFKDLSAENKDLPKEQVNSYVAGQIDSTIEKDLSFTDLFRIIPKKAFLVDPNKSGFDPKKIEFANWAVLDAQALVKGWYSVDKKETMTLEVHLYDVLMQKEILSKKFFGPISQMYRLIHKVSNEIIDTLTGEKGIFNTKIAFIGNVTGNKEIYAMDLDGRNVVRLTSNKSINLSPDWSKDGKRIAFTSFKGGNGSHLYIGDLDTKRITSFKNLTGTVIGPVFNTAGDLLAITYTEKYSRGIFLFNPLSGSLKPLTTGYAINVSPSFSPDGKQVAFASNRSGNVHIYRQPTDGSSEPVRLTFKGIRNVDPAWSPRGDKIAFAGLDTDGHYDIFIMNTDGSNLKRLTYDSKNNEHPSFSPDAQYLIFSSNRSGKDQLYVTRPTAMSEKKQITFSNYDHSMPSWSPRLD